MPAENIMEFQTIVDNLINAHNPDVDALVPEINTLVELETKMQQSMTDLSKTQETQYADVQQFFHTLKNLVGKLEQIKNPSELVAKSIRNLQLNLQVGLLMLSTKKIMPFIKNSRDSLDTISAKSNDMKEFDNFINQYDKLRNTYPELEQSEGEEHFKSFKEIHKMYTSVGKINDIFNSLSTKIETIDQTKSSTAYREATNLLTKLTAAQKVYYEKLATIENTAELEPLSKAFIKDCTDAINSSRQVLEKERGWGEFLTDLLESLVKAVVTGVTLGFGSTNFSFYSNPNKDARKSLDEAQADLGKTKLG